MHVYSSHSFPKGQRRAVLDDGCLKREDGAHVVRDDSMGMDTEVSVPEECRTHEWPSKMI